VGHTRVDVSVSSAGVQTSNSFNLSTSFVPQISVNISYTIQATWNPNGINILLSPPGPSTADSFTVPYSSGIVPHLAGSWLAAAFWTSVAVGSPPSPQPADTTFALSAFSFQCTCAATTFAAQQGSCDNSGVLQMNQSVTVASGTQLTSLSTPVSVNGNFSVVNGSVYSSDIFSTAPVIVANGYCANLDGTLVVNVTTQLTTAVSIPLVQGNCIQGSFSRIVVSPQYTGASCPAPTAAVTSDQSAGQLSVLLTPPTSCGSSSSGNTVLIASVAAVGGALLLVLFAFVLTMIFWTRFRYTILCREPTGERRMQTAVRPL